MQECGDIADDRCKYTDTGQHVHKLAALGYKLIGEVAVDHKVDHYQHGQRYKEIVDVEGYKAPEFSEEQFKE